MTRIRRLSLLPPERRSLLLRSWFVLAAVRLGLTFLSYNRVRQFIGSIVGKDRAPNYPYRNDVAWAVPRAARLVPGATCLTQALAAQHLLSRRAIASTVRIGVAQTGTRFEAHAWLLCGDEVIVGNTGRGVGYYRQIADLEPVG